LIKVLIVDDSASVTMLLSQIINEQNDMQVIGKANNGRDAIELAEKLRPDIITMDIHMPGVDGFEATRTIMQNTPTPIVIISSLLNNKEMKISFKALEEGALAVLEKPPGPANPKFESVCRDLVDTLRAMSGMRVIRKREIIKLSQSLLKVAETDSSSFNQFESICPKKIIAIASSTGGPAAIKDILSELPEGLPVPIVIVQHISSGFLSCMVDWIQASVTLRCEVASQGQALKPGHVYFAPDGYHMMIEDSEEGLIAKLEDFPPINLHRPSATPLFKSVAASCGDRAIGIVLTGMGSDGAEGLLEMKSVSATTFVQDKVSSIVHSMPEAALAIGAASEAISIEMIAPRIIQLLKGG
jgi:two-component system, chemotaxis family, protein-glutamate methylesterase/glutaminase